MKQISFNLQNSLQNSPATTAQTISSSAINPESNNFNKLWSFNNSHLQYNCSRFQHTRDCFKFLSREGRIAALTEYHVVHVLCQLLFQPLVKVSQISSYAEKAAGPVPNMVQLYAGKIHLLALSQGGLFNSIAQSNLLWLVASLIWKAWWILFFVIFLVSCG